LLIAHVSGLPSPLRSRFCSANRPNSIRRVLSGGSSSPNFPRAREVLKRRWLENQARQTPSAFVFPGKGKTGHIVSMQHPHKAAIEKAGLESFEYYARRHTFATRMAESGMNRFGLCQLMGHSSPSVTAKYYVHVTEEHVAAGFEKFVEYQQREVAKGIEEAFPKATAAVQ
jgi:site-specific recombinase XerD